MNKLEYIRKDFVPYFKEMGLDMSFSYFKSCLFKDYKKRHKVVKNYIHNEFESYNINLTSKIEEVKDFKIWVLWWQGEKNMPPIVKLCQKYLRHYAKGFKICLITEQNFSKYVNIPSIILDKLKKNKITITQFSDIMRFALLKQYGGLWIDATVLLTDYIVKHKEIYSSNFYTLKFYDENYFIISHGRWSGYLMGTNIINHPLYEYGLKYFEQYWNNHNVLIDYFLIDYIIEYLYCSNIKVKNDIDLVPINNKNHELLERIMNNDYKEDVYTTISKDTFFHKLSRKLPWDNPKSYLSVIDDNIKK